MDNLRMMNTLFGVGIMNMNAEWDEETDTIAEKMLNAKLVDLSKVYDEMLKEMPDEFKQLTIKELIEFMTTISDE